MPWSIAKKQQLTKTARKNANVTRTNEDGSVDTLKNGSTADCAVKHPARKRTRLNSSHRL